MKNQFKIIDYTELGIPHIEVHGEFFHHQDLYELVGRNQYMTTFNLKENSPSQSKFGKNILGVIYYSFEQSQAFEKACVNNTEVDLNKMRLDKVRIDSPRFNLSLSDKGNLKYDGLEIIDIEFIGFLPYKPETELHDTGEKKIPNIVELKADFNGIDPDFLYKNHLISKINDNVELVFFEKEKLIGITLAINDNYIDSRILEHLGFNVDSIKENINILYSFYKVKERRGTLSSKEKIIFSDIKDYLIFEKLTKLLTEVKYSNVKEKELDDNIDNVKKVVKSVISFNPSILMHGKKQVYWDIDSYIHIVMRHLRDYQIGEFKNKTPFLYKAEDIEILIEKVIRCVENEIQDHFFNAPDKIFIRNGSMAIEFNGDYYNLRIDTNGRLFQFHSISTRQ